MSFNLNSIKTKIYNSIPQSLNPPKPKHKMQLKSSHKQFMDSVPGSRKSQMKNMQMK